MAIASLLTTAGGAVALASSADPVSGPPSVAEQEKGMKTGLPFHDPDNAVVEAGARGELTITLDAEDTHFSLAGKKVWGRSYNGDYVAPTIHFDPGVKATVHLVNHLPVATNIHFHGLHTSPTDHGDDDFLCIPPGQSRAYHLAIRPDHAQGTFWYHSHAMGTTCPTGPASGDGMFMPADVENQVFAGLSGALIVGDDRTLLPAAYRHIETHTFVFKDAQIDAGGHIVQNTAAASINSDNPTVRLVNGQLRPTLTLRPDQTQLWRLVNTGADIFYQLRLDGYRFTVIGEDGVPVAGIRTADTLLLPPGKRFDVLVRAHRARGQTWLRTTAYSNGPQGDSYPDTQLVKVEVAGSTAPHLPDLTGSVPTAPADLANAPIVRQRAVHLTESADGLNFFINGEQFDMNHSIFADPAKLGTVEEWTITNASGEDHPFHLHVSSFQVMAVNGVAQPYTHRQDIVPVPHADNGIPGSVVIRIPFDDFAGRWMFHCHIAAHEDNGMMSFVDVV
jgi:FtsP/CotA-like multicopper oxidase with cupredoxin domain